MPRRGAIRCYSEFVRRFLITLLLAVLPLQSVWAAAAAYCGHVAGTHQTHFGHHNGHHHGASADTKHTSDNAGSGLDNDATHCHGVVTAMLMSPLVWPMFAAAEPPACQAEAVRQAPALSPPERPQWISHA
ncbi:MAG: hypothetical protein CFE40_04700 [Burkholderiales bacterium PBB1]|nr:MAG: hypothetical protein CFE40_04700 [Burkholderiales bacterium PBB1]